jgi:uncharacterized membrane protein YfcA
MPPEARDLVVFLAACAAGAVNSVAGGGTLLTFPTLVWLGVPPVVANVTNAVALWPGSIASAWTYRRLLAEIDRNALLLVVPGLAGGIGGGVLLLVTPADVFGRLAPFLILFATGLFVAHEPIQRRLRLRSSAGPGRSRLAWTLLAQLAVALYGGYFGGGMGILILASLSLMGHTHIHRMNALKNLLMVCISGSAVVYFALTADVLWREAIVMATGAIAGGVSSASLALRLGPATVRRIVAAVGLVAAVGMLLTR